MGNLGLAPCPIVWDHLTPASARSTLRCGRLPLTKLAQAICDCQEEIVRGFCCPAPLKPRLPFRQREPTHYHWQL